ncbi:MAG: LexA family transcriptional regulator [Salinivirgaceae bacterium]|nr:LexA family transcriptional regulator [Salinivirgaceae bacterium]
MDELLGLNIKYLRKSKGLTQDQLADKIGVNRAMIGSYEEGRAVPKLSALRVLSHYFGMNIDKLVNTDVSKNQDAPNESIYIDPSGKSLRVVTTIVDRDNKEFITLVPVKASAGYLNGYADPDYIETLPRFALPVPELSKEKTYRAFQIKGNSMEPIPSGSYIICEYIRDWNGVKDGQPYVLLTREDGIVFKRVFNQSANSILLMSNNPEYEPFEVTYDAVSELWKALGYISFTLPDANEMSLGKLSAMMFELKSELNAIKNKGTDS